MGHEKFELSPQHIFEYFKISNAVRQEEILHLLESIDALDNSFAALCSFSTRSFIYLSPNVTPLLGYSLREFYDGGFSLFQTITPTKYIPYIMQRQSDFIKKAKAENFNFLKPFSIDIDAGLLHKDGHEVTVHQAGVALEYEPGGDFRTFFAVWNATMQLSEPALTERKALLDIALNEFHRLIFSPGMSKAVNNGTVVPLVRLKTPEMQGPRLTYTETQFLILLAKGLSLKEAAVRRGVSYFTAETHRRNLFTKFEVRNVAELVKKASKIYWFD